MSSIIIQKSVDQLGVNLPSDDFKIGASLVDVGPDRSGAKPPPLRPEGLGQSIEGFQRFQGLSLEDGLVDQSGRPLVASIKSWLTYFRCRTDCSILRPRPCSNNQEKVMLVCSHLHFKWNRFSSTKQE